MKTLLTLGLLLSGLVYFSCNKEKSNLDYPYEAKVLGLNSDCGLCEIKITQGLDKVKSIIGSSAVDSVYIAKNLPSGLMTNGINIKLDLRKPKDNELGVCTDFGLNYTWIFVTNAIKK